MKPDRWRQIEHLYHAALERAPNERMAFLDYACGDDQDLRQEVESLLAYDERAQHLIETPPDTIAADMLAAEQPLSPIGRSLGHYRIISLLGKGGMGEVYRARDTRLGREVALKLLPAAFSTDKERLRRFEQEARAASALNHPNIVTIHEIGQVDSTHYIVTEFVEGDTLRQQMAKRKMGIVESLDVATQVASALSAAHTAGIVHRDIKPENLMVRPDGLVKVLDFGLAKLTEPRSATVGTFPPKINKSLTEPGQVMGTPHYMSPEQARGVGIDARSDIFSLGVVLYEMIAGRPPFAGATPTDLIIAIVQEEPAALSRYAPEIPSEMEQVVSRALCKDQEGRYQTARELLLDLKGLKQRLEIESELKRTGDAAAPVITDLSKRIYAAVGRPKGEPTAQPVMRQAWRWGASASAAAVIALLAISWLWLAQRNVPVIAVLPFKNLSTEPESEHFVDGLTDEIIRDLSLIEGLEVRSRTSSFAFKDKPRNLREVGEQLKVNFVVEGSVLRSARNLRINAQFVRVSDDVPLWSGRFDREMKDVFTIQDEISRSVVNELRLKLGRGKRRYDTNLEAYEPYLKARSLLIPSQNAKVSRSAEVFEQVIAKDPTFAPAYAGLADAYAALSANVARGHIDPDAAYDKIRPAAERALQLDPLLAEAHSAVGLVYSRELDWARAEKAFRRATELNPNLTMAYISLAYSVLAPTGRVKEALQEIDKASKADPLSGNVWGFRGQVLVDAGRYDEGIESCRRAMAIDPHPHSVEIALARALLLKGKSEEAITILEHVREGEGRAGGGGEGQLGYAYAITGRRAEAEALAVKNANVPRRLAWIYAGLGDKDRVFGALDGMVANKDPLLPIYLSYPELALIRGDPRLAALRKKVGLK
jgi:eukaryotic-like serine/threonine-protein kinase